MLENRELYFLMEVENTIQISLSAIVVRNSLRVFNCSIQEIRFKNSVPYTPQENGKIERIWGISVAKTCCFLDNAG